MMTTFTCLFILVNILIPTSALFLQPLPEDGRLNFTELSIKYGYPAEEHEVVTEDGFILRLFHMPGRRKTPVLLMHGIADSADTFIIRGNKSLTISLAEAGYDVWAGNIRGSKYSRRHLNLNPDTDGKFWDYSFHECALYDLPAFIDYILQTTAEKKLQLIGHSQGTTMPFVLLSKRPEYNDKIKIFIALAPVAFLSDLIPPVSIATQFSPAIGEVLKSLNVNEMLPEKSPVTSLIRTICSQDVLSYELCFLAIGFHLTGFDTKRFEPGFHKVFIGHYPGATSRKSLLHYGQIALSKRFCEYDYGATENVKRYGFMVPVDYNLREVSTNVALLVGRNDPLSRIKDVEILRTLIPNIVNYRVMKSKTWSHLDFSVGNDMKQTLFPYIFQLLDKYE